MTMEQSPELSPAEQYNNVLAALAGLCAASRDQTIRFDHGQLRYDTKLYVELAADGGLTISLISSQ
jgi:hypothetical protein